MKKALLIISIIICSAQLYSAEPLVKFYLQDGSTKQYNLSDIDNMKFPDASETLQLQVFTNDSKTFYFPAQLIDTITLSTGQYSNKHINLWHDGFKWDFAVHKIDSISIYYTAYVAVTIGTQHWMYRNLNLGHYRNGDSITEVIDPTAWAVLKTGAWCYHKNDPANGAIYSKLYNWYAVNDPRGLAPQGWHVSSDGEWATFTTYLGGGDVAGGKLKEKGTSHWLSPNSGATNESGFSALPGSYRYYNGAFDSIGDYGGWWSSTENYTTGAWRRSLGFNYAEVSRSSYGKGSGFSVRCIKD